MTTSELTSITVNAGEAATAWLNAFLAHSEDEGRPALCRTLSVELFNEGVHFIGCDGTILLRTWVPCDGMAAWPELEEAPERSIVVMDLDKFAVAFMRTLSSAASGEGNTDAQLEIAVEASKMDEEAETQTALGEAFVSEMLTLKAFGQSMHCRLYESAFPDWRRLQFGLDPAERVEGMKLAVRMFATVGKLKGVSSVDCSFLGSARQINITARGETEVRGLMMPMKREEAA